MRVSLPRPNGIAPPRAALRGSSIRRLVVRSQQEKRVVVEGDLVQLHYVLKDMDDGTVIENSYETQEPLEFEVGAGEAMGNPLFRAYDEAVRGLALGDKTELEAEGGLWNPELLFKVPREHPEIQRLEGRYKAQGGVVQGAIVELSNGGKALVLEVNDQEVTLDANNMLAGKKLLFELEVVGIASLDDVPDEEEAAAPQN